VKLMNPIHANLDAILATQSSGARHDNEAHKVREWETTLRLIAGERDGARAIEWARAEHALERIRVTNRTLSDHLAHAYSRFVIGDKITADLEWRKK